MLPLWYLVLGWLLSVVAVAGNAIVIYLIITRQSLHTTANWFVLSLATADFFVSTSWFVTDYLCNSFSCDYLLRYVVVSFLYGSSATNLCLMTLDRYIAIVRPLRYTSFMTTKKVVALISTAWLAVFVPHMIFFLKSGVWAKAGYSDDVKGFMIFDFVVFETLPLVVLPLATGHIFVIARRLTRQTAALEAQVRFNQNLNHRELRSTQARAISSAKMIIAAAIVFIICYLFEVFYSAVYQLPGEGKTSWPLLYVNSLLYVVNSASNPAAYALYKKDIKKSLRSMVCCRGGTRDLLPKTSLTETRTVATERGKLSGRIK